MDRDKVYLRDVNGDIRWVYVGMLGKGECSCRWENRGYMVDGIYIYRRI